MTAEQLAPLAGLFVAAVLIALAIIRVRKKKP
jgi:hypothetical protein